MTDYSSSFREGGALIFNQETVHDFAKVAKAFLGEDARLSIEFEGNHTIESQSIAELFDDPYIRSLRIKSIQMRGRTYKKDAPSRSLTIKIDREDAVAAVSVEGDREACVATRAHLENLLKGCRLPYAPLFRPAGIGYNMIRGVVGWTFCLFVLGTVYIILNGRPKDGQTLVDFALFSFAFSSWLYWAAAFLCRRMFPKLLFDIGKSAEQVRSASGWRQVVFVGFILAIAASIVATLITNRLSRSA